jgi:hypothetical protein
MVPTTGEVQWDVWAGNGSLVAVSTTNWCVCWVLLPPFQEQHGDIHPHRGEHLWGGTNGKSYTFKFEMGFRGPKGTGYHRDTIISAVYSHPAWVRWGGPLFCCTKLAYNTLAEF